jgi:hypothetical protein
LPLVDFASRSGRGVERRSSLRCPVAVCLRRLLLRAGRVLLLAAGRLLLRAGRVLALADCARLWAGLLVSCCPGVSVSVPPNILLISRLMIPGFWGLSSSSMTRCGGAGVVGLTDLTAGSSMPDTESLSVSGKSSSAGVFVKW